MLEPQVCDARSEVLGPVSQRLQVDEAQQQDELVAAVAARDVLGAQGVAQRGGDRLEDLVACLVPVLVVDLLEEVDVDEDDPERPTRTVGAADLALHPLVHEPPVVQARERVAYRLFLELLT